MIREITFSNSICRAYSYLYIFTLTYTHHLYTSCSTENRDLVFWSFLFRPLRDLHDYYYNNNNMSVYNVMVISARIAVVCRDWKSRRTFSGYQPIDAYIIHRWRLKNIIIIKCINIPTAADNRYTIIMRIGVGNQRVFKMENGPNVCGYKACAYV